MIGLTGGIGMGKSTAARVFRRAGIAVFDADREVHRLGRRGGQAVDRIRAILPAAIVDAAIDRARLRRAIADDPSLLALVERTIHPLVRLARDRAIRLARRRRAPFIVLDVPLLFETGGDRACDLIVVVSAPAALQRARVRRRGRMSDAEAERLIGRQMPDREKRRRADIVVLTGLSRAESARQIRLLVLRLRTGGFSSKGHNKTGRDRGITAP